MKDLWEEKVVEEGEELKRSQRNGLISTPLLTSLLALFFVIILGILFFVFYTSNGGSNKTEETSGFYGASGSNSVQVTTTESTVATSETTTTVSQGKGDTITVLAGEGAGSIAARAGISVEQLQSLNPSHMTLGYWYANPGDEVYIN